ncbi:MAG: polyphosphate kinase 1, partial [Rhodothermia bacterium]|nr:polyphosphate kinase 1 [Rhodothermia bacterium]
MTKNKERYFDRELSWLAFNERVLQEAESEQTPLLERLKFLAIFSSNLDEFFRVRVASIRSLLRLKEKKLKKLDYNPQRLLLQIHQVVDRQQRRFGELFRTSILPELRANGIFLHVTGSTPDDADYFLRTYFANEVAQHINPVLLEATREPPFLKNGGLYLVVPLWPKEELDPIIATDPVHGLVEIPAEHTGRFVQVAREPGVRHVMFVDDVLRYNLSDIFPFHDVGEAYEIKLTRDAELYIDDEFSVNLVEAIRKSLKKRDTGLPTRLLFDQRIPYPVVTSIKDRLSLNPEDLVVGGFYHNFSDFFHFP